MRFFITTITAAMTLAVTTTAQAFCGFYVSRADTSLYNEASQVVLVRDEDAGRSFRGTIDLLYRDRGEVVVAEKPVKAGIDPYNKLVDRNSDDVVRSVPTEQQIEFSRLYRDHLGRTLDMLA